MTVRIVRREQHRVMAWKNGGGTTSEIAIEPPDANLATGDFLWRLSIAGIDADGPFSAFPGVDRTIMLVQGPGMVLTSTDGTALFLDRPFVPQDFPGEWSLDCRLMAGPVRDLNLMVNRTLARAQRSVLDVGDAPGPLPVARRCTLLVHGLQGYAKFSGIGTDWADGTLTAGETLIADISDMAAPVTVTGAGTIFAAVIERRGEA